MLYSENKVSADELRRNEYLFWGVALTLLVVFLGRDAWWGREAFFAEAVREMVQRKEYFVPIFNYAAIGNMPLPLLWEGILFGKLFGVTEWSLRLVISLNATFLLWGTVSLAKLFFSRRVALLTGVLLLGSGGFLYTSRLFLDVIPAAMFGVWGVYFLLSGGKTWHASRLLAFTLFLLLAMFFGSFYAVLPPLVSGIALLSARGKGDSSRRKEVFSWIFLFAVLAAAGYFLRDFGALPAKYPSFAGKWEKNALRAFLFDGVRVFFPWSIWGLVAVIQNWVAIKKAEVNFRIFTFAVTAVWLVMLIPSMGNWRQMIYLLPFLSILTAAVLSEDRKPSRCENAADGVMRFLTMLMGAFAVASLIVLPVWKIIFRFDVSAHILWVVPLAGIVAQTFLLFRTESAVRFALPVRCGSTVLAALTMTAATLCVIRPNLAPFRAGREFIQNNLQSPLTSLPETAILYYGARPNASVLFYSNVEHSLNTAGASHRGKALRDFLTKNNEGFVAVIADADATTQAEIAAVAADFSLGWQTPSAQEKLPAFRSKDPRLTLYYGSAVVRKEDVSTSNEEEKP